MAEFPMDDMDAINNEISKLTEQRDELLAALKETVCKLEMIASAMRGGLLGHGIGLAVYEGGVRRCHKRAAEIIAKAEGRGE